MRSRFGGVLRGGCWRRRDTPSKRLILTVGLPGCGKSTYLRQIGANAISSDHLRQLLSDDITNQQIHRDVFLTVRYLLRRRLELGRPETYVDATNVSRWERRPYIALAQMYGAEAEALYFDVPLDVCKQRNRGRSRIVPEYALDLLARRLAPPSLDEGFTRITRIPYEISASAPTTTEAPE